MTASTFDGLKASLELKQAGVGDEAAEPIIGRLRAGAVADLDQLSTRKDLQQLATKDDDGRIFGQVARRTEEFCIMKSVMGFFGVVMLAVAGWLFEVL